MANGDIFGGIFDDLRSGTQDIKSFFDSGYAGTDPDGSRTLSKTGEQRMLDSGWQGSPSGSVLNKLANSAATVAPLASNRAQLQSVNVGEGQMSYPQAASHGATKGTISEDPMAFERSWLERASSFARLENIVEQTKGGKK